MSHSWLTIIPFLLYSHHTDPVAISVTHTQTLPHITLPGTWSFIFITDSNATWIQHYSDLEYNTFSSKAQFKLNSQIWNSIRRPEARRVKIYKPEVDLMAWNQFDYSSSIQISIQSSLHSSIWSLVCSSVCSWIEIHMLICSRPHSGLLNMCLGR